jgi:PAS domain-containing protein
LRSFVWIAVAALLVYTLHDHLSGHGWDLPFVVLRLAQFALVAAVFFAVGVPFFQKHARLYGALAGAAFCASLAVDGALRGEIITPPLTTTLVLMGFATFLPWGPYAQLAVALAGGVFLAGNVLVVHGGWEPAYAPAAAALALAAGTSVCIAYVLEGSRRTIRRQALALIESERQLAAIVRAVPVTLHLIDLHPGGGGRPWVSENIEAMTGFPAARFLRPDATEFWLSRLHPDDLERVVAQLSHVSEKNVVSAECRWRCADGGYR